MTLQKSMLRSAPLHFDVADPLKLQRVCGCPRTCPCKQGTDTMCRSHLLSIVSLLALMSSKCCYPSGRMPVTSARQQMQVQVGSGMFATAGQRHKTHRKGLSFVVPGGCTWRLSLVGCADCFCTCHILSSSGAACQIVRGGAGGGDSLVRGGIGGRR